MAQIKILLVEDEDVLALVIKEKLEEKKLNVEIIKNGDEVMAAAKNFKPDLIVLDLLLPKKHGIEVLAELKIDTATKSIAVFVLSNLDNDEDIKKALSLGAVDYFVKIQHPLKEVVEKIRFYAAKAK